MKRTAILFTGIFSKDANSISITIILLLKLYELLVFLFLHICPSSNSSRIDAQLTYSLAPGALHAMEAVAKQEVIGTLLARVWLNSRKKSGRHNYFSGIGHVPIGNKYCSTFGKVVM